MEKWVLSVVGIVALSVLLDIIIPDGDMSKYIKGVFAIMTVSVIFAPLPALLGDIKNGNFDLNLSPNDADLNVDSAFVEDFDRSRIKSLEDRIRSILVNNGAENVGVGIDYNSKKRKIDKVTVVAENYQDKQSIVDLIVKLTSCKNVEVRIIESG